MFLFTLYFLSDYLIAVQILVLGSKFKKSNVCGIPRDLSKGYRVEVKSLP